MDASLSEFQTKILRRATLPDEYKLYRGALEWDLADPIVIQARTDLKSEKRWRDRLEPYHHQITNLITFCARLVVVLTDDEQKQSGGRGRKGAVWSSQRGRLGGSCV
jgi:hypothetical protein